MTTVIASGCALASNQLQDYNNTDFGLSLRKPSTWNIEYHERNRSLVISDKGNNRNSALVVVRGIMISNLPYNTEMEMTKSIENLENLYGIGSLTILQKPTSVQNEQYEMGTAIISIPTDFLSEHPNANRLGSESSNKSQIIELLSIQCDDNFALIYLYKGDHKESNIEAETLISSINLTCS